MIEEVEKKFKSLLKGEFTSLYLEYNDHSTCYTTAKTEYQSSNQDDFISNEERERALEKNSVWTLQWYPDTPIGSYRIQASSLTAIFNYLEEERFN